MAEDSEYEFSMIYDGEALQNNTMDVKDLAPSLLALGQMFERANSLFNGSNADISLNIKTISPGSFNIALMLNQITGYASPLSSDLLTNAVNLSALIIGTPLGIFGLIEVIKKLKGKKPNQIENNNGITLEVENIKITISNDVAKLLNDRPMRDYAEALVRPLTRKGIDKIVFRDKQKKELQTVKNEEADYFVPYDDEITDTNELIIPRQRLQITSLTFKEGKWSLNDGSHTNWYSMDDKDFISAIEHGESFGKYHLLICEVVLTQKMLPSGKLKMEYAVKRVINHIIPEQQLPLEKRNIQINGNDTKK